MIVEMHQVLPNSWLSLPFRPNTSWTVLYFPSKHIRTEIPYQLTVLWNLSNLINLLKQLLKIQYYDQIYHFKKFSPPSKIGNYSTRCKILNLCQLVFLNQMYYYLGISISRVYYFSQQHVCQQKVFTRLIPPFWLLTISQSQYKLSSYHFTQTVLKTYSYRS